VRFILPVFHILTVMDIQVFGGNNYWTFDRKKSPLVGQGKNSTPVGPVKKSAGL
jgi:hypothetical protein